MNGDYENWQIKPGVTYKVVGNEGLEEFREYLKKKAVAVERSEDEQAITKP